MWVLQIVLDGFSIDACLEMKVYISLVYYKDYMHCMSVCVAGNGCFHVAEEIVQVSYWQWQL